MILQNVEFLISSNRGGQTDITCREIITVRRKRLQWNPKTAGTNLHIQAHTFDKLTEI
jgi:tripartite-type tricarboxylate transporter receptor subunit TctC